MKWANNHNGGRGTARNVCLQQPGSRPRCRGSVSQRKHPWSNPPRRQAASDSCWGAASYTFLECGATGANRLSPTLHTSITRKGKLPVPRYPSGVIRSLDTHVTSVAQHPVCGSHTLFPDYPNISKSTEKAYTAHWHSILWLWITCVPNNKHFTESLVQKKREYQ